MKEIVSFINRRHQLIQHMEDGVAIIPTAPEAIRNRDSHYLYRFDSYFYYLTGFTEPESVLLLVAGEKPRSVLFCRDKDIEREIWDGFRHGPEGAKEVFGVDEAYSISRLDELAPQLLANQPRLHYSLGADASWDARVTGWLNQVRAQVRGGVSAPAEIADVRLLLDEMRLFKSEGEIAIMRRAAEISSGAHRRAMRATKPGSTEYEIEAELIHEFRRHGAQSPAYHSIVAGGANACVLHYVFNDAPLRDGDLLLIDAGCELDGYASDITRTFPVNGKFSSPQRDLYELVLASQAAAIEAVRPGNHWNAPHEAALQVLVRGFIDFGLCKGTVDAVLESGDYRRFYMHRTGHWLGLDVHDAGEYKKNGEWRLLEPGMALTVEPGCYVRPADNVPEHYWNIGIRIEDDAVVTQQGCDIITQAAPKSVADIEALMAS
ncbi:Xaa-Pro aminopeptidase [Methylobacillus sp. MM3]|jgi:Xaa-Pro aminopeptidase|uniref:Xaa-Pro aminopeptidase n=1 Tax=Methylobacillus sp. MM3 TaxID=1848039 RepID=UPI0007E16514|nr:Xaa-Pro aminopeptidase [Methylobacillus sp. MM3]OAJ71349.1 Xaa-Pro aminopeptidase [Methylobacillus sp. MM3]